MSCCNTNDLVLMSETIKGLRNEFPNWKEAFESKGKIKVMVRGGIKRMTCLRAKLTNVGFAVRE